MNSYVSVLNRWWNRSNSEGWRGGPFAASEEDFSSEMSGRSALRVRRAVTPQEINDVFRLRYQVYCVEKGFERSEDFPEQMESDEYDQYSFHLIAYIGSVPVGTVRFIRPNSPLPFPLEKRCGIAMKEICGKDEQVGEISRLAVSTDAAKGSGIRKDEVTLALIRELFRVCRVLEPEVQYVFAAMTRGLQRRLKKCGLDFIQAGEAVSYNGVRAPCYASMEELGRGLSHLESADEEHHPLILQYA